MEFLSQYGLFLLKSVTVVIAFLIVFAGFFAISRKPKPKLEITSLNENYQHLNSQLTKEILGKKLAKAKKDKAIKPTLFVLDFQGDIKATQVDQAQG